MALCTLCYHGLSMMHFNSFPSQKRITLTLPRYNDLTTRRDCWVCSKLSVWLEQEFPMVHGLWRTAGLGVAYHRDNRQYSSLQIGPGQSFESGIFQVGLQPFHADGSELRESFGVTCFLMPVAEFHDVASPRMRYHERRQESNFDLAMVQEWIHRCNTTHGRCKRQDNDTKWYPTRLLRLDNGGRDMKLVITQEYSPSGPYMTLSHRWGAAEYRKLTSATSKQFQTGIDTASLPSAFQEAGVLASMLGVSYLWIDSLCIEQDADLEDWRREAPTMGQVYSRSYLNIAATLSPHTGTTSLFDTDSPHPFVPTRFEANIVKVEEHERGLQEMKTYVKRGQYFLMDGDMWDHEVEDSPLKSRGWVYQECLLASRVLHFGKRQLAWECQEGSMLELFPQGIVPGLSNNPAPHHLSVALSSRAGDPSHNRFRDAWNHLVNLYSKCDLTKAEDKLIALAGVATRIETARQDQYMAGLWKSTLLTDLAWTAFCGLRKRQEKTAFRAPSWSWLSLEAEVDYAKDRSVAGYFAEVCAYPDISGVGSSVFLARGTISISSVLMPLGNVEHNKDGVQSFSVADFVFEDGWGEEGTHLDLVAPSSEHKQLIEKGIFMMPLYYSQTRIHGIVVARSNNETTEYSRVGSVQIELRKHDLSASAGWTERTPAEEIGGGLRWYVHDTALDLFLAIRQLLSGPARELILLA